MKRLLKALLTAHGGISSKRSVGVSASFIVLFISIVDLFSDFVVTDYVFDGLIWLSIAGMGFVASEKFAELINKK
jgi:hypothetical protein